MAGKVISDSQPLRISNILTWTVKNVAEKYPVLFEELFAVQNIACQDDGLLCVLLSNSDRKYRFRLWIPKNLRRLTPTNQAVFTLDCPISVKGETNSVFKY